MSGTWKLAGKAAVLSTEGLQAAIDLTQPERGVQRLQTSFGAAHPAAFFLGVQLGLRAEPMQPAECWERGGDLVAIYENAPAPECRTQLYWRVGRLEDYRGPGVPLELEVSVQTNLLDAQPEVAARSSSPAREALAVADAKLQVAQIYDSQRGAQQMQFPVAPVACVLHLAGSELAWAEAIHPDDCGAEHLQTSGDGRWTLTHRLFPGSLEKGVILRARIAGVLAPQKFGIACGCELQRALCAAPLPLTT